MAAVALPLLLSYELPPSRRAVQQCLAVIGWGLWLLLAAGRAGQFRRVDWPLPLALGAMGLAALAGASWAGTALPAALSAAGVLFVALLVADAGRRQAQGPDAPACLAAVCAAILLAARANALVAIIQVTWPALPDLPVLAISHAPGRASGNLRQANHLASLMLWGLVATAHLHAGRAGRHAVWVLRIDGVLLSAALALSGSRWGLVGLGLVAAAAMIDRRGTPALRRVVVMAGAGYLVSALVGELAAGLGAQASGVATRWQPDLGPDAGRNGRFALWKAAWTLALQHPWTGVGWGRFNLAWSLQPMADRGTALFDHAHSLPLHLAAELGLPTAAAVLCMLGMALLALVRDRSAADAVHRSARRTCWLFTLVMLGHSLLEHPLWHVYFLLPCVWLMAFGLATGRAGRPAAEAVARPWASRVRASLATACLLAGLAALVNYLHVTHDPLPPAGARGTPSSSWLFGHVADFRTAHESEVVDPRFLRSALDFLVDPELLERWAKHLDQSGRCDDARAVRRRLHEFASRSEQAAHPLPMQSDADHRAGRWRSLIAPDADAGSVQPAAAPPGPC